MNLSISTVQWLALMKGFGTSAGLIVAIGAQNAFVLSTSLRQKYHWQVAGLCIFFDILLISLGVSGMGFLITQSEILMTIASWGGAIFLFTYGAKSFYVALKPQVLIERGGNVDDLAAALLTATAVTLLNPHAYLDTLVLLGSIGGQYPPELRFWFVMGAVGFSVIWFFGIAAGARFLQKIFLKPKAWQVLDILIGLIMWLIAVSLFIH